MPTTGVFDSRLDALGDAIGDALAREAIATRLLRVESGVIGGHKALGGGLSELRVQYGPAYRLYCTFTERTCVMMLCRGDKCAAVTSVRRGQGSPAA